MKITAVDKNSPLAEYVKPGYRLLEIDHQPVEDNLDCMFKLAEEEVVLTFETDQGERLEYDFNGYDDLGLTFEPDRIKVCRNKCIFCFVHQQPKGMRRALYVRDDDYRLSFTHGNFISFSNMTQNDLNRIVEQGLSPLYVSVHTTDDNLRREMFKNKNLPPIIPQLKRLTEGNIMFHTQVVVCPGINDGVHLDKTINDLFKLYPQVATLGIVPIGLTKYRQNLPSLNSFNSDLSKNVLDYIESKQIEFKKKCGSRFVFAADEFYIQTERDFPSLSEYESMEQFENGVGMMRVLLTDFNRRKRFLKNREVKKRILFITGESACPSLDKYIIPELRNRKIRAGLLPVKNKFWGNKVTVSGLLTGSDILRQLKKIADNYDVAILPPNCLNNDELFLDDMSLAQFREKAGIEVKVGSYSIIDSLKEVAN